MAGETLVPAAQDLQVVDAHAHLIDLEDLVYPWIQHRSPVLEALLDSYYDAAHQYDAGRYRADVGGRVTQWVACEFGAADGVAEAEYVQRCSESDGGPAAFIGAVDLTSAVLGDVLARYRDLPVVHALKLQGLALLFGPSQDMVAPWVRTATEIFGVQRCMFAAHFPIDRLLWRFDDLIQTLLATLHDLSGDDLQAVFSGCASREYQLEQAG